jgi:adenylate kinase family enzyme
MSEIGRHIIVCGSSCSGKTTLAANIAQKINVPHIEIDAIFWKPDWEETPVDELRAEISAAVEKNPDGWVIDGNYHRTRDLTLSLADTVIWLRLPFRVAFWRLLKRTIARCIDKKPICGANYETWRQAFFSRDSLILYLLTHWQKYERMGESFNEVPHNARIIQLHSSREVAAFLDGLPEINYT